MQPAISLGDLSAAVGSSAQPVSPTLWIGSADAVNAAPWEVTIDACIGDSPLDLARLDAVAARIADSQGSIPAKVTLVYCETGNHGAPLAYVWYMIRHFRARMDDAYGWAAGHRGTVSDMRSALAASGQPDFADDEAAATQRVLARDLCPACGTHMHETAGAGIPHCHHCKVAYGRAELIIQMGVQKKDLPQ